MGRKGFGAGPNNNLLAASGHRNSNFRFYLFGIFLKGNRSLLNTKLVKLGIRRFGGPTGIRTPDLLSACPPVSLPGGVFSLLLELFLKKILNNLT